MSTLQQGHSHAAVMPSESSPPHPVAVPELFLHNSMNHHRSQASPRNHHIPDRPLTTHTLLGSPINSRIRSHSIGSAPVSWSVSSTHHHSLQNGSLPTLDSAGPISSNLPPPEPSVIQKAMEAASAAERVRARKLEEHEANMSADELRHVLKQERHRTARFAADLVGLRQSSVQSQMEAEVIEEGRINGLVRRLDILQQEKGRIIVELEREEELLTNTLIKKLDQVKREKAALEKQIEKEKEAHVRLQDELQAMRTDKHLHDAEALEEEDEIEMEE
ncbi:hypothetical protein MPSEU_000273700 [Mayamaea pseudoterrestris]|nr:hypothetical protein MPSEU_000273700 [Mayamaea pseudoterrestris]